ncbi:MAG: ABC transporter permease [Candidatus Aminicenantes bacterium]|nr:ABC transporter permease [Candidatus Aminicenantes bacterium]
MNKRSAEPFDLIIEPKQSVRHFWRDLWEYRELFYFLSWRDVLVQYKQTAVGIVWSVLRPLLTMLVFTFIFGRLARLPAEGLPYPVLVFCGMLPWHFFASALTESSQSLVGNANLITKIYFPRLIIPISSLLVGLVDFLVSFVILCGLLGWHGLWPNWHWLALPLLLLLACAAALGAGLWFAAWNVKYRDFRYVIPFVVQFGLYISPVGFSSTIVPAAWRSLYALNPMVGVIDGFRWAVSGGRTALSLTALLVSAAVSLVLLGSGLAHFRKMEREFADVI